MIPCFQILFIMTSHWAMVLRLLHNYRLQILYYIRRRHYITMPSAQAEKYLSVLSTSSARSLGSQVCQDLSPKLPNTLNDVGEVLWTWLTPKRLSTSRPRKPTLKMFSSLSQILLASQVAFAYDMGHLNRFSMMQVIHELF
jgi:hypothetical protein